MEEYLYLIYDGRYHFNPDRALVMEVCETLEEARENRTDYGDDSVIVKARDDNHILTDVMVCSND